MRNCALAEQSGDAKPTASFVSAAKRGSAMTSPHAHSKRAFKGEEIHMSGIFGCNSIPTSRIGRGGQLS